MTWWCGTLIAVASIQVLEYLNRSQNYPDFGVALWHTWPFILMGQYGLWKSWDGAPSLLMAWVLFFALNVTCRTTLLTYLVGESPNLAQIVGTLLAVSAAVVIKVWG